MLVNLKEIMQIAEKHACAVGAFNTPNLESLEAVIGAAEECGAPVILQFAQCHEHLTPLQRMGPIMAEAAKGAAVPVCVHLDHGETLEYLETALKLGFSSVMYDGSSLPYEENLQNTVKAVHMAAAFGAGVEAELGSMGKRESGQGFGGDGTDDTKIYTDAKQAGEFVKASGIDALACSFGTTHGIYRSRPRLDFEVVRQVRKEAAGIPVVMHGGSGVSKEEFQRAVEAGVRKVNYFTYMDKAGGSAAAGCIAGLTEGPLFFSEIAAAARAAMKENVKTAMNIFGMGDNYE